MGTPASGKTGRLEIYMKNKWGSVCNMGFKNNEAAVACRLMGYDSGSIGGEVNDVGFCSTYNDKDYCGPESLPIHVKIA